MNHIPPYPGLRPFNEDESIFFKGRDEHIASITHQLEQKKFVMITGASGDGKSSLVYAGVVPNARAGFFKAKFNNWLLVDFRPERSPLKNLAVSLNDRLKLGSAAETEKGLSYGFSSLVDVYKKSAYYLDTSSEAYVNADEKEKRKLKSRAGNLFILLDQFEEFFTNKENYTDGRTSQESRAVMNLLLETMKIAVDKDLPIYIACTMRSDYIGQCAAFRGLPEAIGYSQFFVPRLKRQELQQVIEEPAKLNGDSISRRLTEVLLNASSEGIDQLPVLQHALNLMWKEAKEGQEEIDLLHFAKVAGYDSNKLTKEDKQAFDSWFSTIPESKQEWFSNPSLDNVLDFHANDLFQTAVDGNPLLSKEDAVFAIETAFKCLTKVDNGRAVRNRMTLGEITAVINKPNIGTEQLKLLLQPFRLQGNTFLKPFLEEGKQDTIISYSVLDITHESLIRNWAKLTEWATEEESNHQTFLDFEKQLNRWGAHNKSHDYLLPIGSLTYFEGFYNAQKPNKYWLAKFDESETSDAEKLLTAEKTITNAEEFISRSSRKLVFTRTVLKYGANKIAAVLGGIFLIIACLYYYNNYLYKQNDAVVERLNNEGLELLNNPKVKIETKAQFVLNSEISNGANAYKTTLNTIQNDTLKLDVVLKMYSMMTHNWGVADTSKTNFLLCKSFLEIADSLNRINFTEVYKLLNPNVGLQRSLALMEALDKFDYFTGDKTIQQRISDLQMDILNEMYLRKLIGKNLVKFDKLLLFKLLESSVYHKSFLCKDLYEFFNPVDSIGKSNFSKYFPANEQLEGSDNQTYTHNGGYQLLLDLAISQRNWTGMKMHYDTIFKTDKTIQIPLGIVAAAINTTSDCTESFYKEISSILSEFGMSKELFLHKYLFYINDEIENPFDGNGHYYKSLSFKAHNIVFEKFFSHLIDDYYVSQKQSDKCNYSLAITYKALGVFNAYLFPNNDVGTYFFDKCMMHYGLLSPDFRVEEVTIRYGNDDNAESKTLRTKDFIIYPAAVSPFAIDPNAVYDIHFNKHFLSFSNYLYQKQLYSNIYRDEAAFKLLNNYFAQQAERPLDYNVDTNLLAFALMANNPASNSQYLTLLNLYFKSFSVNDSAFQGLVGAIDWTSILNAENANPIFGSVSKQLARKGCIKESILLLRKLKGRNEYRNTVADIIVLLNNERIHVEYMPIYADMILTDVKSGSNYPNLLFRGLSNTGSQRFIKLAFEHYRESNETSKKYGLKNIIRGMADVGLLYKAVNQIPNDVSSDGRLELITEILHGYALANTESNDWENEFMYWYDSYSYSKHNYEWTYTGTLGLID